MSMHSKFIPGLLFVFFLLSSCRKLVTIPEPVNTMTTTEVFSSDAQANSAMAGIYTQMINGDAAHTFSDGLTTFMGGLSSDDLVFYGSTSDPLYLVNTNRLVGGTGNSTSPLWSSAYTCIYGANSVIEGIAASSAGMLHDSVRKELTAEAKFIRAFCYFYLTNFYGDVPLVLTVDFNQTVNMARTAQSQVYAQMIKDLKDAQAALPTDYSVGGGERIRPNKWAATALLARVYLYTGDYADALAQAGAVIANSSQFILVSDPNGVFLKNSTEAIWQLQQSSSKGTATSEGAYAIPDPLHTGSTPYKISPQLLAAFEPGDLRRSAWVDSTDNSSNGPATLVYFPFKYKTGYYNNSIGGVATEYYMVLRLAEQYLIRAEAEAGGAGGGDAAAIADLNIIRARAGLPGLSASLIHSQVIAAVAHERQTELFAEWGHRWFDLKRTGQAHTVLSQITLKQPWQGDYQLLYPISISEITADHNLVQNPGY